MLRKIELSIGWSFAQFKTPQVVEITRK